MTLSSINLHYLEYAANGFYLLAVFLAARNSIHTWWLGIIGCALFAVLFFQVQLYAESMLMLFFIITNVVGWYQWGRARGIKHVTTTSQKKLLRFTGLALFVTAAHGFMLHSLTNGYAPYVDSAILMFSLIAQFLLMNRKLETWWFWLLVNTIAIPLYISRELYVTAIVYCGFWFNAWYGLYLWRKLSRATTRLVRE
ncbi:MULTISPECIES: nicotinamide riboside transporter PnuC [unclassified Arsukibacterium]|uniref:nicotinamide riboside transporter PnuC n=1 Tax=unclassified Arsukibacterium TaxID=2635278 RepID=UPI000C3C3890|nr:MULTISPECIES: nicotinamide riboside transporter PnuC [unclassified Arsukibacterium]MBM34521.1 nicotinamide mononucleotide transporter [Rheinheimera sp.]HAW91942.1 nicotinamide mononucleotide transporter [Candidatus Azambacteria bacterium]